MTKDQEYQEMYDTLEAIRCNSEPDTIGGLCDLPEETAPHTREQHLEAQIRMLNKAACVAIAKAQPPSK